MGATLHTIHPESVTLIVVDLFCGGGGVSEGFKNARNRHGRHIAYVAVAVNHWPIAIESHAANHPDTLHLTEDIWLANVHDIAAAVRRAREMFPRSKVLIWMSAECTHYSKAKGGESRDAKSRTLPESIFRYLDAINPDYLYVENVVEFLSWGPLVPKIVRHKSGNGDYCQLKPNKKEGGRLRPVYVPESRTKGRYYMKWVRDIEDRGYTYDYKILNCANYGCYTSRERYFGIFAKHGLPVSFPTHSHAPAKKLNSAGGLFSNNLKPWRPVREVLDLYDEGESIFERNKTLVEATLERIYEGLLKFAGKEKVFLSKYFSGHPHSKNYSAGGPAHTITCKPHDAIVFLQSYYGNGSTTGVDQPANTVTTHDRFGLVTAQRWIDRPFSQGGGKVGSIDAPAGSILTVPKMNLVTVKRRAPWIMDTQYRNIGQSIDHPALTITADRHCKYLLNPQYGNAGNSIEAPAPTIIARQDKRPLQLVSIAYNGNDHSKPQPGDSPMTQKIRAFMRANGIPDIRMRMLKIIELKLITGFHAGYILKGNQSDQKEMIGNAVPVDMVTALAENLDYILTSDHH